MDDRTLYEILIHLDIESWQSIASDKSLLLVDDQMLRLGSSSSENVIIPAQNGSYRDAAALRDDILQKVDVLITEYYRVHPLTTNGFNRQVEALFTHYGVQAFSAPVGQLPDRSLFVDVGTVVAESIDSPRHRYGVYYEYDLPISESALIQAVRNWLSSGQAYECYLSMNVCRYSC